MSYICQKCYKSKEILEATGKLQTVDGYLQCKDCYSDLEYESVVIRQIYLDNKRYLSIPYPDWYEKELKKKGLSRKFKPLTKKIQKEIKEAVKTLNIPQKVY